MRRLRFGRRSSVSPWGGRRESRVLVPDRPFQAAEPQLGPASVRRLISANPTRDVPATPETSCLAGTGKSGTVKGKTKSARMARGLEAGRVRPELHQLPAAGWPVFPEVNRESAAGLALAPSRGNRKSTLARGGRIRAFAMHRLRPEFVTQDVDGDAPLEHDRAAEDHQLQRDPVIEHDRP